MAFNKKNAIKETVLPFSLLMHFERRPFSPTVTGGRKRL